jgi:Isopropylmalate/homocitrate/citramalate synthases
MAEVFITECPRDAIQGIDRFIDTDKKVAYLQLLLRAGFDRLDFGSFVSPKAIPQLRDTGAVLERLDVSGSSTRLLAIVANVRGATEAAGQEKVNFIGFPFSVSETFQLRNTNSTIAQSLDAAKRLVETCAMRKKTPLVYLSMGFGNPYGDPWSPALVGDYAGKLEELGVSHIAIADTVGSATPDGIASLYAYVRQGFPWVELGLHLHSTPQTAREKLIAALDAGCNRFDTALRGFGGCPMAADRLTGNIATEVLLELLAERGMDSGVDMNAWDEAVTYSAKVF